MLLSLLLALNVSIKIGAKQLSWYHEETSKKMKDNMFSS